LSETRHAADTARPPGEFQTRRALDRATGGSD
jgi:hypothetical protein